MNLKAVGGIWGALLIGLIGYAIYNKMNETPQPKPQEQGG